jgi:hypothetical protein
MHRHSLTTLIIIVVCPLTDFLRAPLHLLVCTGRATSTPITIKALVQLELFDVPLNSRLLAFKTCVCRRVVLPRLGYGWLGSAFDGFEAITD